jgi:DNA-directed RNA polymerase subunit RPC12/RpoP
MALIDCPSCSKKISDKAKQCSHCQADFTKTSTEDAERKQGLSKFKRSQRIQNQSMLAMIMFIGGLAYMFTGERVAQGSLEYTAAISVTVLGFVWYIVNRVRMIWLKRFS